MKKLLNNPNDYVAEMLNGLLAAHSESLAYAAGDPHCIVRADAPVKGKVALATGGGSGHLPVFLGYVGRGLLDGCAVGDVFASPNSDQMLEVTKRIHGGAGVVYIYGNYGGDIMNFDMAAEMAALEDIEVRTVLVKDDVASAPPNRGTAAAWRGRHGLCLQGGRGAGRPGRLAGRGRGRDRQGAGEHPHHGCGALPLHRAGGGQAHLHHRRETRWRSAWASTASRE